MNCRHEKQYSRWVGDDRDDYGTLIEAHWEYTTERTTIDIDTHRYKCTQCGEVMYYSGAAREYYETGLDRKELFK